MQEVMKKYGGKTAKVLVALTHRKVTLKYNTAYREKLLDDLARKLMNNSDSVIDFSEELTKAGKEFYHGQMDFLQTSRAYAKN